MSKKLSALLFGLSILYFATHLYALVSIPVFADEAIYIRWAQLIITDYQQYLFFPLNDGKTPLFIWLLVPVLKAFNDPLLASRALSVLIGFAQILVTAKLLRVFMPAKKAVFLSFMLITFLPFWFFHHRLALIDSLVVLWVSLASLLTIKLSQVLKEKPILKSLNSLSIKEKIVQPAVLKYSLLISLSIALALFTKVSSILLLPALFVLLFIFSSKMQEKLLSSLIFVSITLAAVALFGTLYLHPAFPQLFARGSDFLFSRSELLEMGISTVLLRNTTITLEMFAQYFSPVLLVMTILLPFIQRKRNSFLCLVAGIIFLLPILLSAKVLHSRYILPAAFFFTVSLALSLSQLHEWLKNHVSKTLYSAVMVCAFLILSCSPLRFIHAMYTSPATDLLHGDDLSQYILDWSSGYGINETTQHILDESKTGSIAVATEGYFGTLPDAITMNLFNQDVSNIYIEGIGEPVTAIEGKYFDNAKKYDKQWLVVNDHRLKMSIPKEKLLYTYCRPRDSFCLQVWDISYLFE